MEAMMMSINEMLKAMSDRGAEDENCRGRRDPRGGGSPVIPRQNATPEQWRKLDVPVFRGEEAFRWLDRMEQYFTLRVIPEREWLTVAAFAMEGRALTWFRWWEQTAQLQQWTTFREAVLKRFQPEILQNPYEMLLGVRQNASVKEFRDQFELYASPLRIADRQVLVGIFLKGLKPEISAECKLFPFHTLEDLMDLAEKVDAKNRLLQGGGARSGARSGWNVQPSKGLPRVGPSGLPLVNNSNGDKGPQEAIRSCGPRHLSNEEYRERRAKGLCFFCEEPYGPTHDCKNKQLKLMIVEDLEESEEDDQNCEGDTLHESVVCLNLLELKNASSSFGQHRAIKAWATVAGKRVRVLIDCGASHNFVAPAAVQELSLPVDLSARFLVNVADRTRIEGKGRV